MGATCVALVYLLRINNKVYWRKVVSAFVCVGQQTYFTNHSTRIVKWKGREEWEGRREREREREQEVVIQQLCIIVLHACVYNDRK